MDIKSEEVDRRVKLYRAAAGLIPGGSFLVEYMIDKIPNQRMDRLFKTLKELNDRIDKLENKEFIKNEKFGLLAEKTLIESSRPISDKRIKWLASITVPNESPSDFELDFRDRSIGIISRLIDEDVEYLLTFSNWKKKGLYENGLPAQVFISEADASRLSSRDFFERTLNNHRLDIHRNSLLSEKLLTVDPSSNGGRFEITELGRMLIYLITGRYPRHNELLSPDEEIM